MENLLEMHLRRCEEELLRPKTSLQAAAQLLADEFVEFGSSGRIYNKQQALEALRFKNDGETSILDFRVRALAPDVMQATYRASRLDPQSDRTTDCLRCSILKMINGRWQLVFHQGTAKH